MGPANVGNSLITPPVHKGHSVTTTVQKRHSLIGTDAVIG